MIKKIIFSLAIILSITTHHAVGMDTQDDTPLNKPAILAKHAALEEECGKEREKDAKLAKNRGNYYKGQDHYHYSNHRDDIGIGTEYRLQPFRPHM